MSTWLPSHRKAPHASPKCLTRHGVRATATGAASPNHTTLHLAAGVVGVGVGVVVVVMVVVVVVEEVAGAFPAVVDETTDQLPAVASR